MLSKCVYNILRWLILLVIGCLADIVDKLLFDTTVLCQVFLRIVLRTFSFSSNSEHRVSSIPADVQQNSVFVYLYSMFLFSFNDFIFQFNLFNSFIHLLFFHSRVPISYSIAECLCNNDIFIR